MRAGQEVSVQMLVGAGHHSRALSAVSLATTATVSKFVCVYASAVLNFRPACPNGDARGVKRSATSASTRPAKRARGRGGSSRGRGRRKASSFDDD